MRVIYLILKTVQIADIGIKDAALVATSILLFVVLAFENKIIISNKDIRTMYIEQLKLLKKVSEKISSLPPNPKADPKRQFTAQRGAKSFRIKKFFEIAQLYPGMSTEQFQSFLIMRA